VSGGATQDATGAGGYGPSQSAKESLTRSLSAEFAPHGIRVVGLRGGMPKQRRSGTPTSLALI